MSAPYPTGDQNPPYPPYPGQGGYAQPPYPPNIGFQQPGYAPQPGYPPQPGFQNPGYGQPPPQAWYGPGAVPQQPAYEPKPDNPPYGDDPSYVQGMGFSDKSIRAGFIRRVYSILSIQLVFTAAVVALFVLHEGVARYARQNPFVLIIPMIGTIVLVCAMACSESARRSSPTNIILLGLFTFFESILVGAISSQYDTQIVLLALVLTASIVIGLTIFAFQTKYDFTMCGGFLCVCVMILMVGSIIAAFFFRGPFPQFLIACAGAAIFSFYIIYDTQIMIGGDHKYSISPEEYIFAALNLYMDIIQLFIYMLRILQYLNKD